MVGVTLVVGGLCGLVIGLALFASRKGGLFANKPVFFTLNFLVNFIRPIPFIIFLAAIRPVTIAVTGHSIGIESAIFPMSIMCAMATSRLVEQSLVGTDPGIIEAGRAMGASRLHILIRILIPEALGPLILGYVFLIIGILDMSAMAGAVGAGGLGNFAIQWGHNKYNYLVVWVALGIIIVMVQIVQSFGNWLSRRVIHR
ncbi:MAG: ABC transporter permease subunit [Propionibacteriaceae bacterium]|nr:ABC transporter permease subunit [Propionibacteriaceae bacterium]